MDPTHAGLLLLGLGLLVAGLAAFAWPHLSKLPTHRVRSRIFGARLARWMTIGSALAAALAGLWLVLYSDA